jgi:DNA-binding XRE family transcriptional regulator
MSRLIEQLKVTIRYKVYRNRRHLSQGEAARKIGLKSTSILSRWEKGIETPTLLNACKLILLYDVPFEELFHDLLQVLREQYPELTDSPHIAPNRASYE